MTGGSGQVSVSRVVAGSPAQVFQILADPRQHTEFDGSGMLRGAVSRAPVGAVGDVFVMMMYHPRLGHYEMNNHVVVYEVDRRIGWEPEAGRGHPHASARGAAGQRWGHRWIYQLAPGGPDATVVTEIYDCSRVPEDERASMDNGRVWAPGMARTLERLDALCRQRFGTRG